jgi:outer membrane protein insertion porin family
MPAEAQPASPAAADTTRLEAPAVVTVGRVSVDGNVHVDSTRILRTFEVAPGSRFSDEAVRRGIRKLFALGLFDDAFVTHERAGDREDLVVHVRERPRISRIDFSGNSKKETSDLEKRLFVRVGETYSPTTLRTQVDSLLKLYRDDGFARVSIDALTDTLSTRREVGVRFVIREGERVRIERIDFPGAHAFPVKTLRKQLKTKAHGFFGGGHVKEEEYAEDRERLEHFYRSHGHRDMRVLSQDLAPGRAPNRLVLRIAVDEGPFYRMGRVSWAGNQVIPTAELEKLWPKRGGDGYDVSRIERTQGLAYAEYSERGYLFLQIEPQETVRDSVVDVQFLVTEGRPSNVRQVAISGNRGTREKVIRREMDLHEGDRFCRSKLMRTRDDISRLGLFEDVQIDFVPAESTDVDIQLKVKEKQVGTASAGAGFTNESGLTGYLELGHNNVLGNGQSVQIHLERGALREDYSVSFTEPWFRDTPTLLGFSLFNSTLDRDLYKERRVGGAGRIGRPLPWPDYSRGSLSYRLENVTITQLGTTLTPEEQLALAGIHAGQAVLTSSLETSFLRNTTDNPFYPTRGTRLAANDEFAGGPFGGSVNFHKHRFEGRLYVPSFLKGVTTMLRSRVGMMGEYGDQKSSVPPYEKFRLGGGTTIDPLRGYDDYQIVPSQFDRLVPDTLVAARFVRVRYPGGRFFTTYTAEQQFPIVHPLHGVVFFDAGNVWELWREIRPLDLKLGAGAGVRLEIPLLGNVGFDYGYGFNRDDGAKAVGHFLLGNINF